MQKIAEDAFRDELEKIALTGYKGMQSALGFGRQSMRNLVSGAKLGLPSAKRTLTNTSPIAKAGLQPSKMSSTYYG